MDDQVDQVFSEMTSILHSLKNKAFIMNDQLIEQAHRIDYLKEQMLDSNDYVQKQSLDMKKMNI